MSQTTANPLAALSQGLTTLIAGTAPGIVAIKALAYRVSTGVPIAPNLVAAADHAVKREERIPIVTSEGRELRGTLLGRVPSIDLALIKTEEDSFRPLAAASSESLRTGSLVAVVGLTIDVGPSASLGVLGAVGETRRTWRGGVLDRFLRLDVNLYPSQTGAAVVNVEGQLIGLATPALLRHAAVAVPIETIQKYAQELLKEGRIRHGYLGVGVQPVAIPESLRTKVGLNVQAGLMVMLVNVDSPAEKAGFQLGDILVSLGSKELLSIEDLQTALEGASIGNIVPAMVVRGGELLPLSVTIAERPRPEKRSETN